jgi:glycosyltransferase involved in cell wall biosynthesis
VEIANLAWGNVDKKMIVMYPPLDIDRKASDISKPEKIEFQKNLKKIRYICFVGRLSPEKGVLELLQIYKILSRTSPNIKLVIVGDGPIWDEAISLTQTLKIELNNFHENVPSIIFCGAVEDPKPILSHSEGLLVPSEVEAFGYVIIEGIEAGVPVFAADVPWGAREALTLGEEWRKEATARVEPQVTDFGFLLPRPHTRSAQKMWADAVVKSLTEKPRLIESAKLAISRQDRLSDFSVEHAKQKWASLILSLDRPF